MVNRIRELREKQGLSMAELAQRINSDMSPSTIDKLEKGRRRLTDVWMFRIATALGVEPHELLQARPERLEPDAGHLAEEAEPYRPAPEERVLLPRGDNVMPWMVKSTSLDNLGIEIGSVVIVDISAAAVGALKPLQCVVVQKYAGDKLAAVTMLRQFVPPSLLITNSRGPQQPILDLQRDDVAIKGVIVGSYRRFGVSGS